MTRRRRVARILAGLVLTGGPVVCAFTYDPPPEPERVAWLCSTDQPHCIALMNIEELDRG